VVGGGVLMVTSATWLGATTGSLPTAAQQAAFLGVHKVQMLYAATQTAGQTTNGAASTSSNNLWLGQSFSTAGGQTAIGYVIVPVTTTTTSGSALSSTTLSLYANTAGAPSGAALASVTVTAEYANLASGGTATNRLIYPLPVTGLTASTTYWLVLHSTASTGSYTWFRSNQASGASTSATGSSWAAQTYGFVHQVFDQTASGTLTAIWEDSGARWQALTYNAALNASTLAQYTAGQGSGYVQGYRALSYSNSLLTKVA
jgi:hypothetical protein